MKKIIFYTTTFILLIMSNKGCCQSQMTMTTETNFRKFEDKTIFDDDTLNGKIKTIIQNTYGEYYSGEDVIYTFDEYGLQVRRQGIGQDIFNYYEGNKVIKSSICLADNGKEYRKNEYLYDERENLIKHIHIFLPDSDSTITQYFYNNENKLIEQRENRETTKYQYDENGDCVIEKKYHGNFLNGEIENEYINHRLAKTLSWRWFEGFRFYTKETYNYNEDGTLKSITYYAYNYDTKAFSEEENGTTFYYYTYDNENRLVKFQEINKNNYKKTITYSNFDEKGNWQLKNTNDYGRKSKIKRKFDYFD